MESATREGTVFASAARTATESSDAISNAGAKYLLLFLDVTAITLTPSVTLSVEAYDRASGEWFTVWTAAAAVTGTGNTQYALGPGLDAAAPGGFTDAENVPVPPTFRVTATHADADSATYSLGYALTG